MKRTLVVAVLLTGLLAVRTQEQLSREEALKYAFFASSDLKEMLKTPIPTDPDIKRPVAVKDDKHGGMVLPPCLSSFTATGRLISGSVGIGVFSISFRSELAKNAYLSASSRDNCSWALTARRPVSNTATTRVDR